MLSGPTTSRNIGQHADAEHKKLQPVKRKESSTHKRMHATEPEQNECNKRSRRSPTESMGARSQTQFQMGNKVQPATTSQPSNGLQHAHIAEFPALRIPINNRSRENECWTSNGPQLYLTHLAGICSPLCQERESPEDGAISSKEEQKVNQVTPAQAAARRMAAATLLLIANEDPCAERREFASSVLEKLFQAFQAFKTDQMERNVAKKAEEEVAKGEEEAKTEKEVTAMCEKKATSEKELVMKKEEKAKSSSSGEQMFSAFQAVIGDKMQNVVSPRSAAAGV